MGRATTDDVSVSQSESMNHQMAVNGLLSEVKWWPQLRLGRTAAFSLVGIVWLMHQIFRMSNGLAVEAGWFMRVHTLFRSTWLKIWIQASRFVLDEVDEDNILDFEHSDDDGYEEERLRQKAESVPLRSKDHVDLLDEVITWWMVSETEKCLQGDGTITPAQRNESELASPCGAPTPIPQVVVNFLVDKLAPPQASPASCAWQLLHDYLTHKNPPAGEAVKTLLDELEVGDEWHNMRIRIILWCCHLKTGFWPFFNRAMNKRTHWIQSSFLKEYW